jgi:hypothetical protein
MWLWCSSDPERNATTSPGPRGRRRSPYGAQVEACPGAHARSGDRVALAAHLGGSTKFDEAIADFAETYADQNERDYAALQTAVKEGRAEATTGIYQNKRK